MFPTVKPSQRLILIAVFGWCICSRSINAATIGEISDFQDATDQGWTNERAKQLIEVRSGGMDGADDRFLFVESTGSNGPGSRMAVLNDLTAWTGDYTAATAIEVDMMNPSDSKQLDMRLVLFGPSSTSNRWTSDVSHLVPNDGLWRHYSFPINSEDVVRVQGSAAYEDMLENVQLAMLRHDSGSASSRGTVVAATLGIDNIRIIGNAPLLGDFDASGVVDVADVDLLLGQVKVNSNDAEFDLDASGLVDKADIEVMLTSPDILNSYVGDSNLDGEFGTADFVLALQGGIYEDRVPMNATWETGDWNGDGEFDTSDFTFAFQGGGYEMGQRPTVNAVPEPSSLCLIAIGFAVLFRHRRSAK